MVVLSLVTWGGSLISWDMCCFFPVLVGGKYQQEYLHSDETQVTVSQNVPVLLVKVCSENDENDTWMVTRWLFLW